MTTMRLVATLGVAFTCLTLKTNAKIRPTRTRFGTNIKPSQKTTPKVKISPNFDLTPLARKNKQKVSPSFDLTPLARKNQKKITPSLDLTPLARRNRRLNEQIEDIVNFQRSFSPVGASSVDSSFIRPDGTIRSQNYNKVCLGGILKSKKGSIVIHGECEALNATEWSYS